MLKHGFSCVSHKSVQCMSIQRSVKGKERFLFHLAYGILNIFLLSVFQVLVLFKKYNSSYN